MTKKKTTIDDLGIMMKKGFDSIDERFQGIDERFNGVDRQLVDIKQEIVELKTGQEDIKLRLDQTVYRFEMRDLEKRVTVLEKHTGVHTAGAR